MSGELLHGRTAIELLGEASLAAIADAGLELKDIDGLCAATSTHAFPTVSVCEYLGIKPVFFDGTNIGGSSFEMHLMQAALALDAGLLCNAVLICYGSNQRTAGGRLVSLSEVLNSRIVSDPHTSRDCCLVTDGGAACVMVRADRAKAKKTKPVFLLSVGAAHSHRSIAEMVNLTRTAAAESGPRAFEMARLKQADVDLVMLYDAFTITTLLFLEDLGFCPKGEGGRFVQDGTIAPGGRLAVNTNGGGLSCVHPGMYGMFLILEGVEQIRGEAGERQLKRCDIALCHGNGGTLSSQVTALFGSEAVL